MNTITMAQLSDCPPRFFACHGCIIHINPPRYQKEKKKQNLIIHSLFYFFFFTMTTVLLSFKIFTFKRFFFLHIREHSACFFLKSYTKNRRSRYRQVIFFFLKLKYMPRNFGVAQYTKSAYT